MLKGMIGPIKLAPEPDGSLWATYKQLDGAALVRTAGTGGRGESHAARLGELLQSRYRPPRVSGDRQLHRCAVTPVVAPQAQNGATAGRDLSTLAPVRVLRSRTPHTAWTRPVVGEGVSSVREPDAGDPQVRFDERGVETERRRGYLGTARRKRRQQTTRT
jgi:hypothetical protein